MNLHENTIFGRKVFFIDPPYSVQDRVIPQLIEQEYEVYVANTCRKTKAMLRAYPDAICFINIEAELTLDGWFNFIKSFEEDPALSTIFVGLLVRALRKSEKERFLLDLLIPSGIIQITPNIEEMVSLFKSILDLNGAKGRRKYMRANCADDKFAYAECSANNEQHTFQLQSISTVGFSCFITPDKASLFPPNTLIPSLKLHLHDEVLQITDAVVMHKMENNHTVLVVLFRKSISFADKATVRKFVTEKLRKSLKQRIANEPPDTTDYNGNGDINMNYVHNEGKDKPVTGLAPRSLDEPLPPPRPISPDASLGSIHELEELPSEI